MWKLWTAEAVILMGCFFGFLFGGPLVGGLLVILSILINAVYWYLVLSFKRELEEHNLKVNSELDKEKGKVEYLTIEQYDKFCRKGYVERGKDKQPMMSEELWRKANGK
jgi:hypothetical protein